VNVPTADFVERVFEFVPRLGGPSDVGFVLNTLERSLRPEYLDAENQDFARAVRTMLTRELEAGAEILVASPQTDPSMIWGWLLVRLHPERKVVFGYVRSHYRRARILTRLIRAAGFDEGEEVPFAFVTADARKLVRSSTLVLRYAPEL
jgi:hypothetical protein